MAICNDVIYQLKYIFVFALGKVCDILYLIDLTGISGFSDVTCLECM